MDLARGDASVEVVVEVFSNIRVFCRLGKRVCLAPKLACITGPVLYQ